MDESPQGEVPQSVVMVVMTRVGRLGLLALRAQRADFGFVRGQGIACLGDAFGQLAAHGRIGDFGDGAATGTDDEQVMRRAAGIVAGAPGVDGVQAVNQAFVHQEVQGAVHRGGRGARMDGAHGIQQLVGLQAAAMAQQQLEDLAADGSKTASTLRAQRFGDAELSANAVVAGWTGRSGHGGLYLNGERARRAREMPGR